jgi:UDP-glucose 4-epimerase
MHEMDYLITGGAGFIGSHLAEALLAAGQRVVVIDDFSTGSLANLAHLRGHPRFQLVRASITDAIVMDRLAAQAHTIIHLAAAVGVRLIVERPVHTIETNVTGSEAVLRAALRYQCRVLLASTSEVYGKGSRIPFSEDDDVLIGATNKSRWAYAASKMLDEFLGLAYAREYGLEITIFRLFNTIGPRQTGRYGMVVPRLVGQALRGEPLTVYGDGAQTRCFCDVRDVVGALMALAQCPEAHGQVFNIGSTEEVTIAQLAALICELTASMAPIVQVPYADAYAPGFEDMRRRVPNIARIQALLGWQSQYGLRETIATIVAAMQAAGVDHSASEDD